MTPTFYLDGDTLREKQGEMMPVHPGDTGKYGNNCPKEIPMAMLDETRAKRNHGQTLKRLKERGGLSVGEMLDIILDRKVQFVSTSPADIQELERFIDEYNENVKSYPALKFDSSFANRDLVEGVDFKIELKYKDSQPFAIPIPPEPKQEVEDQGDLWYKVIEEVLNDSTFHNEGLEQKLSSKYIIKRKDE